MNRKLEQKKIFNMLLLGGLLLSGTSAFSQTRANSLISAANTKTDTNYTIPSFTEMKRQLVAAQANLESTEAINKLENAINNLKAKEMPYNIVMNIYQDPKTKMAFNWFTNKGITGGKVQIVQGTITNTNAFNTPLMTLNAKCIAIDSIVYTHSRNELVDIANIVNGIKKSYTENKAVAIGLTPGTTYSFRVGKDGAWSEIGTFTTAKANNDAFSFIYTTDPQANTYEMFDISQRTTHAAFNKYPNVGFWLHCGDLVESSGSSNSEWEWEQLFETQQDLFLKKPFAPIQGNHDNSANRNFAHHFNTDSVNFDRTMAQSPGSVYSYVYNDVLFLALNFEDYGKAGYLDSLANWMTREVAKHPNTKWRIAYGHKSIYTGSTSHQSDSDGKTVRDKIAPIYDSLKIDIALEGHDHIYEVMGPIYNKQLVQNAVSNQQAVAVDARENVTGKFGGTYDVKKGTVYLLNNSSGKKKYEPRTQAQMAAAQSTLGIADYYSLFTGRFGQTGRPTFSNVSVSADTITITTYEVWGNDSVSVFDEFKVVKSKDIEPLQPKVYVNKTSDFIGTYQNIDFKEGGFSGMYSIPGTNGTEFYVNTDRGPNIDFKNAGCTNAYDKMYPFPAYAPKINRVKIAGDSIQISESITIKRPDGSNTSGLLNPVGFGSTANELAYTDVNCATEAIASKDIWGIDAEGIAIGNNNDFWLCEEGGATIWNLDNNGKVLKRYSPFANMTGVEPQDVAIDSVFKYRKNNRGFEGLAITPNGKIYAMIQSPILYPTKADGENSYIHRLLEIDPVSGQNKMYAYLNPGVQGTGSNQIKAKDWKIGDLSAVNDSTFLVIEQGIAGNNIVHNIYEIKINQATPITSGLYGGKTVEQLKDSAGLASQGIKPVQKQLFLNLMENNWPSELDKAEGLAIINDSTIAVCNDNDYGQYSPNEDGIAVASGIKSYIYVYTLPVDRKIQNYVPRQANIVADVLPVSVSLNKQTLALKVDSTETLTTTVLPANATNKTVSWTSSNIGIATVDANGTVKGITAGTALIIATTQEGNMKDTCTVTIEQKTGIRENALTDNGLKLYPNPVSGQLTIESSESIHEVSFYNANGQLVKTVYASNNNKLTINAESFPSGLYTVYIHLKNSIQIRKVIVK